jgi:hypothetical protein
VSDHDCIMSLSLFWRWIGSGNRPRGRPIYVLWTASGLIMKRSDPLPARKRDVKPIGGIKGFAIIHHAQRQRPIDAGQGVAGDDEGGGMLERHDGEVAMRPAAGILVQAELGGVVLTGIEGGGKPIAQDVIPGTQRAHAAAIERVIEVIGVGKIRRPTEQEQVQRAVVDFVDQVAGGVFGFGDVKTGRIQGGRYSLRRAGRVRHIASDGRAVGKFCGDPLGILGLSQGRS